MQCINYHLGIKWPSTGNTTLGILNESLLGLFKKIKIKDRYMEKLQKTLGLQGQDFSKGSGTVLKKTYFKMKHTFFHLLK